MLVVASFNLFTIIIIVLWCVQEVAGLTEKDVQSDIFSPTAAGGASPHSSNTLSESQYTHVLKLFSMHSSMQVLLTLLM